MNSIVEKGLMIIALLSALVFHEVAHGAVAYLNGDPTAKNAGRLTLNPLKHLDPLGVLAMWIFRFGWAKPVPIDPESFRHRRLGLFLVSLAGVVTNFILGFLAALLLMQTENEAFSYFLNMLLLYNVFFAVFNLLPLPPLDGSNVLLSFLPRKVEYWVYRTRKYSRIVLIILIFSGLISKLIVPLASRIVQAYIEWAFALTFLR